VSPAMPKAGIAIASSRQLAECPFGDGGGL
jgi:hypothetical protein